MTLEETVRAKIAKEARSWIGTPFYPHTAKKGVGADCVHFVLAVYQAAGAAPAGIALPSYELGGGDHLRQSIVVSWLSQCPYVEPESGWPGLGSVVAFRFGKVEHHVGIVSGDGLFIHALRTYGVMEVSLRDPTWSKRMRGSWGPVMRKDGL